MRHAITAILTAGLALTTAAPASASTEEHIGVGSGAVIGAVAAGPVGLILGAAIGAKVGDTLHRKNDEIGALETSLADSRSTARDLGSEMRSLESELDTVSAEVDRLEGLAKPEVLDLLQTGIAMDLLFRTDEHVLANTTGQRLAELATTLASMPDIRVQLDGFADERGDADYNHALSKKRVDHVRELLVAAGVDAARISVSAHGEVAAAEPTTDSFALERRVSLTLFIENAPSLAANPD